MFKASRWRSEKNKIKVVFKLQFHATQVSLVGVDALAVSVVPADAGRPTTKLEKATIKDGSCYWDNPVHETVKFIRDPKSGKIQERIYHFVVENGSSKGGVLGDASIDMSCYALATKSSSVSLLVKCSKSEVLLHVSIQRMSNSVDERGSEEIERLKQNSQDRSLRAKMSIEDIDLDINTKIDPIEDVQLSKSSNPISKINGINRRESNGSDITLSSTDSSLGIDSENIVHHDPKTFFSFKNNNVSMPRNPVSDESSRTPVVVQDEGQKKSWEWLGGLALESSTDDSSESGDNIVEKLKRQAEMSELELQALRKQIVKESRKGHDLSKEILKLKEERECLKEEFERFKANPCRSDEKSSDLEAIVVELRQELSYEKDLNKNLQIQLEKTRESNSELLLAVQDLDEMVQRKNREREEIIEKSAAKTSFEKSQDGNSVAEMDKDEELNDSRDLNVLDLKIRDLKSEMEKYRTEKEEIEVQMEQLALDYELSKQENHEILYKLEQCELQDKLKMQYECSSPYVALNELENQIEALENELNEKSERSNELESQVKNLKEELDKRSHKHTDSLIATKELEFRVSSLENELIEKSERFSDSLKTITELESEVKNLKDELEKRSHEHSDSLIATKELEFQVLSLEDELEKQAHGFESDLEALTRAKVEQEQRAIQAEETLKKMRWLNASATERLQDEFRKLSVQMTSSFEANESLAAKALTDANELRMQKILLEEKLRKAFESSQIVREQYKSKLQELSGQVTLTKQLQKLQSESDYKSERIEHDSKLAKQTEKTHEQEISMLKTRIAALETENQSLLKQLQETESLITELDHKKSAFSELEARYEQCKKEKAELETRIALVKSRAEESLKELRRATCLIDEKDAKAKEMQMELEKLENQCNLMKKLLSEDEFEKEKLRNEVFQMKNDLKRKEDSNLQENIKLLEDQIKQKEFALENSTSSFMEKEKELHRKIEGLEQSLQALSQKATKESETIERNVGENPVIFDTVSGERDPPTSTISFPEPPEELKSSVKNAGKLNELLGEMALMKERNEEMECELKEMQERYSEISLKFAEVEGERQQLVMKLRYLKNSKKTPVSALAVA